MQLVTQFSAISSVEVTNEWLALATFRAYQRHRAENSPIAILGTQVRLDNHPAKHRRPSPTTDDSQLTISEAAAYIRASEKTLRRAVAEGRLSERRIAGTRSAMRFMRHELDAYLIANGRGKSAAPTSPRPTALSAEARSLLGLPPS
jgi:excisionase family DNA binding protein